jgi:hypothetical protein
VVLLVALLLSPSVSAADRVLADRIAAVVELPDAEGEARIVLASTVEAIARMRLVERRSVDFLWAPLPPDLRDAVLDEVVNEILLYHEAERLGLDRVSAEGIEEERARTVARFVQPERFQAFVDAYDLTDSELREIFTRRRVVREFLAANVAPPGGDAGSVRADVARWVATLRSRAKVRVLE